MTHIMIINILNYYYFFVANNDYRKCTVQPHSDLQNCFLLFFLELKHHKTKQKRTKTKKMKGIKWNYAEYFWNFFSFVSVTRGKKRFLFSSNPLIFFCWKLLWSLVLVFFNIPRWWNGWNDLPKHFDQWGSVCMDVFFNCKYWNFVKEKKTDALTVTLR